MNKQRGRGEAVQFVAYFGALFLSLQRFVVISVIVVVTVVVVQLLLLPYYCAMFRNAALFQQNAP